MTSVMLFDLEQIRALATAQAVMFLSYTTVGNALFLVLLIADLLFSRKRTSDPEIKTIVVAFFWCLFAWPHFLAHMAGGGANPFKPK